MTLVPVREDRPRYAVLVTYERRPEATPRKAQGLENATDFVIAVRRTWEWLQDAKGKWRWQCTRVTELRRVPGLKFREWPRKLDREYERPEAMRRTAIRAARLAAHVDPVKGVAEPDWDAVLQLRLEAEARERAGAASL